MIDLAMPRDIDPAVYKLDDVYLYDLDSLQSMAERTLAVRKQEWEKCYQLIELHVQDFQRWMETHPVIEFSLGRHRIAGGVTRLPPLPRDEAPGAKQAAQEAD